MGKLKFCSFNVRGINDKKKRIDVFNWLKRKKVDICFLQEVHSTKDLELKWRNEWGYEAFFSSGKSNSKGVAILFNNTFEFKIHNKTQDTDGRFIILDLTINEKRITIMNVYGPNQDDPMFYESVKVKVEGNIHNSVIIGGDFNVVQDYTLDTLNIRNRNNPKAHEKIMKMKDELDIIDPWRDKNPNTKLFTWHNSNNKQSRIDYFLVSTDLNQMIDSALIKPGYKSDHSVVEFQIKLDNHVRGPGIWKHNSSLLLDNQYTTEIRTCITNTLEQYRDRNFERTSTINQQYVINDQLLFEMLKTEIRGKTIAYATAKKKAAERDECELDHKIDRLHEIYSQNQDEESLRKLTEAQNELKSLRDKKIDGIMMRAKAKWHLEGERNTKYFCNLEKLHYTEKSIHKLIDENDDDIIDIENIMNEQKKFYENLYKTTNPRITEELSNKFFPENENNIKLTEEESAQMENAIDITECYNVLKNMKPNKSPGSDGFTVEFYKYFWNELKYPMLRSFNETFDRELLSGSQRLGVITCLPKPGKPKEYMKNWRPISLINVDYKILSGVISNRIKMCLDPLISSCQKGFVAGRYIGECTRLISDIIHNLKKTKKPGILLMIDFEKAFDSLEWSFIDKTLKYFNFGENIQKWIKIFYNQIESCIINNGHVTERFKLSRGVRQGDPLSPYLFILCAEILTRAIKNDNNIKGINIDDSEYILSQLADDTTIFLEKNKDSYNSCMELLIKFSQISGLKVNFNKTTAVKIGFDEDFGNVQADEKDIKWQLEGKFTLLGIKYDLDANDFTLSNYEVKLNYFRKILDNWNHRNLTMYGKVCIIKSLALPKLVHLFSSLPNPPINFIKNIEDACFDFIWNGKNDKIKRTTMYSNYDKGGLRIPNIRYFIMAQKISWVKKILDDTNFADWKTLFLSSVERYGGNYIWLSKSTNIPFIKNLNPFWKDVYESWVTLTCLTKIKDNEEEHPLKQTIFHNINIKINKRTIFYRDWLDNGIKYINDLLDEEANFYSWESFSQQYGIQNQAFNYYALLHAIPRNWKKRIKKINKKLNNITFGNIQKVKHLKKPGRYFYKEAIEMIGTRPVKSEEKWKNIYDSIIPEDEWSDIYMIPFKCTSETKLRILQLKILHRILPTNSWLYKCNLIQTKNCTFCQMHVETIEHLLWDCFVTKNIWLQLFDWLKTLNFDIKPETSKDVILGDNQQVICLEHIKLIVKEYIYNCQINKVEPNYNYLINIIKSKISIEKHHSERNLLEKKWGTEILEYFRI